MDRPRPLPPLDRPRLASSRHEPLEHPVPLRCRHSGPVVLDHDNRAGRPVAQAQPDGRPGVPGRVVGQVGDRLTEPSAVTQHPHRLHVRLDGELGEGPQPARLGVDQVVQVDLLDVEPHAVLVHLGQQQEVLDQPAHPAHLGPHHRRQLAPRRAAWGRPEPAPSTRPAWPAGCAARGCCRRRTGAARAEPRPAGSASGSSSSPAGRSRPPSSAPGCARRPSSRRSR